MKILKRKVYKNICFQVEKHEDDTKGTLARHPWGYDYYIGRYWVGEEEYIVSGIFVDLSGAIRGTKGAINYRLFS